MGSVLFINSKLRHEKRKNISPPLGIAYLCAALQDEGVQYDVFDCNLSEKDFDKTILSLGKNDIVAFSCMTPNYNYTVDLCKRVKALRPDLFICLGGYHASLYAKEIIYSKTPFDALILGNGEESIVQLYKDHKEKNYASKPNIIYRIDRDNADFVVHKTNWPNGIIPDRKGIYLEKYIELGSDFAGSVQFSRGCVYACNFCSVRHAEGCWAAGNVQQLIKEFEILYNDFGLRKNFVIVDNLFTGDKRLVMEFCDLLIKKNIQVKWSCDVRIDDIDKNLVEKMFKAGCISYFVGLESGNDESLRLIGNKPNKELVKRNLDIINQVGIRVNASFILGMPWENEKSIMETIDYAINLPLYTCEFSFATPFPQTRLRRQMFEYGAKIVDFNYDHWDGRTPVMSIPNISRNRLMELYLYAITQKMRQAKQYSNKNIQ